MLPLLPERRRAAGVKLGLLQGLLPLPLKLLLVLELLLLLLLQPKLLLLLTKLLLLLLQELLILQTLLFEPEGLLLLALESLGLLLLCLGLELRRQEADSAGREAGRPQPSTLTAQGTLTHTRLRREWRCDRHRAGGRDRGEIATR